MASSSKRPISPHLQIWRWGPAMAISILHRVTGTGLATFGLGILLWWLSALASGPAAYASFTGWVWADLTALDWSGFLAIVSSLVRIALKVLMIGLSWSAFQHLLSGLRHFVLDIGAGYDVDSNNRWSVVLPVIAILLTASFWAALLLR